MHPVLVKETFRKIEIMKAAAGGATIEIKPKTFSENTTPWQIISSNSIEWDWPNFNYRIKSNKKKKKLQREKSKYEQW